jgi:hypothetical protein
MKFSTLILALLLALAPALAVARSEKLEPPQRFLFVAPAGQAKTLDDIRGAIATAGSFRGWQVIDQAPGRLTMKNVIRGKHTVVVAVVFDTEGFQIDYVSSENLNYEERKGQAYVHPKYLQWTANLAQDINVRMAAP